MRGEQLAVRLDKPWRPLSGLEPGDLPGQLGVFELGDEAGRVLFIGYAGGKSRFGLRSEIMAAADAVPAAQSVRYEVTTAYHSRYRELLMAHVADHGGLPPANPPMTLGRLSPN